MKNNRYNRLLGKIYLKTFIVLISAVSVAIVLRLLLRGKVALNVIEFISSVANVNLDTAEKFYILYIQNNMEFIAFGVATIISLVVFYLIIRWLTRYFEQMECGIDTLTKDTDEKIVLCQELDFLENKLNDVKEKLKKREYELKMAEQRKNDLIVYLAHDIKTPLTSVIGYLSLLDEEHDLPIDVKAKYLHISLEKAYRLETLVNEFFEITRYNLQDVEIKKESINLCYMMVQVTDELYPQASKNDKVLKSEIDENIEIQGDPEKLARVFNNILKNAINYGEKNSEVNINATKNDDSVVICFRNVGTITKEDLEKIFDKFYRADEARTSSTGGAGLGLAISKDIVLLHGGNISASCDGEFTTITVKLPV